jgi:hypothetical protein
MLKRAPQQCEQMKIWMISNFFETMKCEAIRVQSYLMGEYVGHFKGFAENRINGIGMLF